MAFLAEFIITVVRMLLLVGVAVGGIKLGKVLRDRKDEKTAAENKAAEQNKMTQEELLWKDTV